MPVSIRRIRPEERAPLGRLMVEVYAGLDGFPTPREQPAYYTMLAEIGALDDRDHTEVLVAVDEQGALAGGVVYFSCMGAYGAGGTATQVRAASGIRLLGVDPRFRGAGIGRALTLACIERARAAGHREVVLHTTRAMQAAWSMYERLGFQRSPDLDFMQQALPVYGFRLPLEG
ncbi:MAG TPA: GNAT family N-acetyltransferase [Lysobacter sp.]|nr:GNAT family N-acetyltransferase [Lysobacter sp.]